MPILTYHTKLVAHPPHGYLVRTICTAGILGLAAAVLAGAYFCEISIRLDPVFRQPASINRAATFSRAIDATWTSASIPASDGTPLDGWLFRPRHPNGDAVIVLHGIADSRSGMLPFSKMMLEQGYTVLAPDSRSHGASGGEVVTFGVKEAGDVHDWVEWLFHTEQPRNLFGLGRIAGGRRLLEALPMEPRFRAAVVESPFANISDIAYNRLFQFTGLRSRFGYALLSPVMAGANLYGRLRYGIWLSPASPLMAAAKVHVPVLLIHDGQDDARAAIPHSRSSGSESRISFAVGGAGCHSYWRQWHPSRGICAQGRGLVPRQFALTRHSLSSTSTIRLVRCRNSPPLPRLFSH